MSNAESTPNRASRRSLRRKSGMVGLSMLATTGLLGAYLGNPRLQRSYASVPVQCGATVIDFPTWGNAATAFLSQTIPCDTIKVGADMQWPNLGTFTSTTPLTIDGQGHTLTPYAGGLDGALDVNLSGALLTVKDVTFTTFDGAPVISSTDANVTFSGVTFTKNTGGVLFTIGGDISITDTVVDDNDAVGPISTIDIRAADSVAVSHSTFTGNFATLASGVSIESSADVVAVPSTITDSYFAGNTSSDSSTVLAADKGAVLLTVTGSTFTGNSSTTGTVAANDLDVVNSTFQGNGGRASALYAYDSGDISFSTFSGNSATGGGANVLYTYSGAITFTNSIVTGTASGYDLWQTLGTVTASNSSFRQGKWTTGAAQTTFATDGVAGNQVGRDPLLGALGDNGGFLLAGSTTDHIPTMLPGATSPVLNAGVAGGSDPSTDQRGTGYVRSSGSAPDMGAVEVQSVGTTVTVTPTPSTKTITFGGSAGSFGFTATTAGSVPFAGPWITNPVCAISPVPGRPIPAGSYDVVCTGGDAGTGYTLSYVKGTVTVNQATPTVTYYGTKKLLTGDDLTLAYKLSPSACTGAVTYALDKDPTTNPASPGPYALTGPTVSTVGWTPGTYTVTVSYAGDANCKPSSGSGAIYVAQTAEVEGSGYYTSPVGKAKFGFEIEDPNENGGRPEPSRFAWQVDGKWKVTGVLSMAWTKTAGVGSTTGTGTVWKWVVSGKSGKWVQQGTNVPLTIWFTPTVAKKGTTPAVPGTFALSAAGYPAFSSSTRANLTGGSIKYEIETNYVVPS